MSGKSTGFNVRQLVEEHGTAGHRLGTVGILCIVALALAGASIPYQVGLPLVLIGVWVADKHLVDFKDLYVRRDARGEQRVRSMLSQVPHCVAFQPIVKSHPDGRLLEIGQVLVRDDGALFLIQTKSLRSVPREQRLAEFVMEARETAEWLQNELATRAGMELQVHASLVFPQAEIRVLRRIRGIDVIGAEHIPEWIAGVRVEQGTKRALDLVRTCTELWPDAADYGSRKNPFRFPERGC